MCRAARSLLVTAAIFALLADRSAAQQGTLACPAPLDSANAPTVVADTTGRVANVLIRATVEARELRFESSPRINVRLLGCAPGNLVRVVERRNLPSPIVPGVTYRDVRIGVEIRSYLDIRCTIPGSATPADSLRTRLLRELQELCTSSSP